MDDSFENWLKERAPETDADDGRLSPGTVIGAYRVETFLGKGGFAEVYGAKAATGERVAIKILHRLDDQSRKRFERESNILSQIHHPNIPKLLSFGSSGNRPYLVTERLHAEELPCSDRNVALLVEKVCAAAAALHRVGYAHRDIKPENILYRASGEPVLIDFGLAAPISEERHLQSPLSVEDGVRVAVGTPGFSAPEQFAGQMSGPASDIHAIGSLIAACFGAEMPRCWRRIVLIATNSNPEVRYQTSAGLCRAVRCRHLSKGILMLLGVIALLVSAYITMDAIQSYRLENRQPNHYRER